MTNRNFVLSLMTKTWVRDSHGLYDYESNQTKNLNAVLAESVFISRRRHDIKTLANEGDLQNDEELLFFVRNDQTDQYSLENKVPIMTDPTEKNINDLSNKIWYVLKPDPNHPNQSNQVINNGNDDYFLCKNDIIKLGRVKYALNEIHIPSHQDIIDVPKTNTDPSQYDINNLNINSQPVFNFIYQAKDAEGVKDDENLCKICYSNTNDMDNPMVHLCNCNGGLRFAHYLCIKKWMETKLVIKENDKKTVKSYNIKSFNCEICKTPYPFRFRTGNSDKIFDLIEIKRPDEDYIILESLNQMKELNNIKSIHVIKLTNEFITIGRGHESDVRINDISVSRTHAWLKYDPEEGRLLLRDLKSKFGTLILLKNPLTIKEKKIHLQIGRTYIEAWLMSMDDFEKLRKEKKNKHKETKANSNNNVTNSGNPFGLGQNNINKSQENNGQGMDIEQDDNMNDNQKTKFPN